MPALKSQAASEKADVAITAKVAVAIIVLDSFVMGGSSGLTRTPANRALRHRTAEAAQAEMPIPNRFDSRRASRRHSAGLSHRERKGISGGTPPRRCSR